MWRKLRLMFIAILILVAVQGIAVAEAEIITAPTGTPTQHWWEDIPWRQGVALDNRSVRITHVGAAVYIDYIRFVEVKTGREVLWTSFDALQPNSAVIKIASLQEYDEAANVWAVRTDSMAHIGGGTLYAGAGATPPPLTFDPDLSGRYDIYVGVRATHFPVKAQLELIETTTQSAHLQESDQTGVDSDPSATTATEGVPLHVTLADTDGVYHAWPSIARRQSGELLVVTYAGEAHTESHGRVVMYRSQDGGRTWDEGTVIADTILDDRDPGILVTSDDTIIVSSRVAWWRNGTDSDQIDPIQAQALLSKYQRGYLIRSTDGGNTWSEMFPYPFQPKGPMQLANGDLFAVDKSSATSFQAYSSSDLGETWQSLGRIDGFPASIDVEGDRIVIHYSEPHFVETTSGRIILYVRAHPTAPRQMARELSYHWLATSDDGGRTWTKPSPTTVYGYPPHALRLRDGRILLTYGHRWHPYGQRAQLSDDGVDFSKYRELVIRDDAIDADLGYPSSVELDDGRILTVYYQKPSVLRKPALIGTIWSLNERPSDLWIGSPRRGESLDGPTSVHLVTASPTLRQIDINVDGTPIFQGDSLPADLTLLPWELQPGEHRLDVTVVDNEGAAHRQSVHFTVEHVRLHGIKWGESLTGEVPLMIDPAIAASHIKHVSVSLTAPHRAETRPIYEGSTIPPRLTLETLNLPDGPYDLNVRVLTSAGMESVSTLPVTVANWMTLEDPILPPSNSGWLGVVDRLKATERSEGWEFVGNAEDALFGDTDRIRPQGSGGKFLVWEMPRLRSFAFTLYAKTPGTSPSDVTLDTSGRVDELVNQSLRVDVSGDGIDWEPVLYTVHTQEKAHAPSGEAWIHVSVNGSLPVNSNATFIRVMLAGTEDARAHLDRAGAAVDSPEIQLGHVDLKGLRR